MTILKILNELASKPGKLDKKAILVREKDNVRLQAFFKLALDPLITFGIKQIPPYAKGTGLAIRDITWAYNELQKLQDRTVTGNAAANLLQYILESVSADDAEVIERIIAKDPKCGVASSVNDVWDKLVFEFPVMKASPHDEKTIQNILFPAYSQLKLDGARCAIVVENGVVSALSSSGREIETHGMFDYLKYIVTNSVLDGELLVTESTGKFMDRKKGNGIVNKALKGTLNPHDAQSLHFVAFDIVSLSDWRVGKGITDYETRLNILVDTSTGFRNNASVVETKVVNDEREMIKHFKDLYSQGQEGTIVKNMDSVWENKRSKYQIKLKGILTCDALCTGVEEGTGRNKGKIGALVCQSADGLVKFNVGTGLTDADRASDPDRFIGKIIEVQYNERILSKEPGSKYSLFLPRFVQMRIDKLVADSIDNISEKGE